MQFISIPSLIVKIYIFVFCAGMFLMPARTQAISERIISFTSDITVQSDASLTITETIRVFATGNEIKRGIFRDFPTSYRDRYGFAKNVTFEVQQVLKNGQLEPYFIEALSNGKRLYIGEASVFLDPGEYTYTITYTTERQLGFFENHDELYWNVTGNDWAFPIENARAVVHLPAEIPNADIKSLAYTGTSGAQGIEYTTEIQNDSSVVFAATQVLHTSEGLTIVVGWSKGFIQEPNAETRWKYFLSDNRGVLIAGFGWMILVMYFCIAWAFVGCDPHRGAIVPQYAPPEGFSPAALRFVTRMKYDAKIFSATIIDLCVKGVLKIEEKKSVYTLHRITDDAANLFEEEKQLLEQLFAGGRRSVKLKNTNHEIISTTQKQLKKNLRTQLDPEFFRLNRIFFLLGILISLLTLGIGLLFVSDRNIAVFGSGMVLVFAFFDMMLVKQCLKMARRWKIRKFTEKTNIGGAFVLGFLALIFVIVDVILIVVLFSEAMPWIPIIIFASVGIHSVFYRLLRQPTQTGRKLLDNIEGFQRFLAMTEKDRLNFHNPPDRTPELFEKYLPYALALDVEHVWAEQFSDVLAKAGQEEQQYLPVWYVGTNFNAMNPSAFASSLGDSFASSIASASHAPSSSSGFSGGGSGGGGGGGGGGGW